MKTKGNLLYIGNETWLNDKIGMSFLPINLEFLLL